MSWVEKNAGYIFVDGQIALFSVTICNRSVRLGELKFTLNIKKFTRPLKQTKEKKMSP